MCMRDTKPSEKVPYELDGEPCSLYKLVVAEPGWAVSRINYSVDRIAELEQELATAIDNAPTKQQVRDEFESAAIDAWKKENASLKEQLKAIKETQSAEVHDLKEQVRV